MSPSVDTLFGQMRAEQITLSFLQQLHNGAWQAAVRQHNIDFEVGRADTAAGAIQQALAHLEEGRQVLWREIWLAGRSAETRPRADAPKAEPPKPAPVVDLFD